MDRYVKEWRNYIKADRQVCVTNKEKYLTELQNLSCFDYLKKLKEIACC